MPTITIGMPVYNRSDYLREAIESILNQTFKDFELLISDNASPNPLVREICEEYGRKDPRIKYFRQNSNTGAHENYKFVYDHGKSEYFMWASDDDLWKPTFVERGVNLLNSDSTKAAWSCRFEWMNAEGVTIKIEPKSTPAPPRNKRIELVREMLAYGHRAMRIYSIFRRDALRESIEFMMASKHIANSDIPFIYIFLSRHRIALDNEVLFRKRLHNEHYIVFKRGTVLANRHFAGYWNAARFTPYPIMTRFLVPIRYALYVFSKIGRSLKKRWHWIRGN